MSNLQEIVALSRAVFTPRGAPKMSERYVHIDSSEVVRAMQAEGFQVHSSQVAARARDATYAQHQVIFRHADIPHIEGAVPQIIFKNSHNGASAATAMIGVYRFVCSNGMVIGDTYAREAARHAGATARDLVARMQAMARNTEPLFRQIEKWTKTDLSAARAKEFARLAAQLRWGDVHRFAVEDLLEVRREEDDGGSLWKVFNRVQEVTTKGGLVQGQSRTGRALTARALTAIDANLSYNRELWELAEEFA